MKQIRRITYRFGLIEISQFKNIQLEAYLFVSGIAFAIGYQKYYSINGIICGE